VRLSPVARLATALLTGRDDFGRKESRGKAVWDTVMQGVPIALQKKLRNPRDYSMLDSMMQAVGISSNKYRSAGAQAARDYVMSTIPESAQNSPVTAQTRDLENKVAKGTLKPADIVVMHARGELSSQQVSRIIGQESKLTDVQRDFRRLPIEKAIEFFPQYEPDEQAEMLPILKKKAEGIANLNRPIETKRALVTAVRGIISQQKQRGALKLKGVTSK